MDHEHTLVRQHIVTVLTEKFEVPSDRLTSKATLGDLELDSLAVFELYVGLQEEWDVPIDDSTASADLTVEDLVSTVAGLLEESGRGLGRA
ncbi:acyl carrier protein [Streptomyces sparsus]